MQNFKKRRFSFENRVVSQHIGLMTVSFLMLFLGLWGISGFAERAILFLIYFNPDLTQELFANISAVFVFVGSMLLTVQAFLIVRNEKQLVEEKQKLDEALLNSIRDGIIATDEKGIIIFMNPQAERSFLCTFVECRGNSIFDFLELYDEKERKISRSIHPLKKIFFLKEEAHPFSTKPKEFFYIKKEGTQKKFPASLSAAPVIVEGVLRGVVIAFRDITKEKEIDEMKSSFISVAAHQLRTPLGSIRWNIEMLIEEAGSSFSETVSSVVQNIYETNKRMVEMVDDLLNASRLDDGKIENRPEHILITPIIQSVIQDFAPEIQKMELTTLFDTKKYMPLEAIVDPKRFRDVLQNIIGNAIRYNTTQGSVSVDIVNSEKEIIITVSDTGIGIPENEKEKLFSRFFRGSNALLHSTDGCGLGLFIVKSYVEGWGGRVWIESIEQKGTTLHFSIPILK